MTVLGMTRTCRAFEVMGLTKTATEIVVKLQQLLIVGLTSIAITGLSGPAFAQGPLLPHVGGKVDTAFSNRYGPDAVSTLTFTTVTPARLGINYSSTRGLQVQRNIRGVDRKQARAYVLGYAPGMPTVIADTTSLGISGDALVELRTTGKAALSLVYDRKLSKIDGQLALVAKGIKIPVLIEDRVVQVPALHARGTFGSGIRSGTGDFFFLDNKNNPMMLKSAIQFSWEKRPRLERITRVTAGQSLRSAMEQSLSTLRHYDLYGIHFDFGKATLRPDASSLIADITLTLKNNPTWQLQINGHTDSIGAAAYNQKLSAQRSASVKAALVKKGIAAGRLQTGGFGSTKPKSDNNTLQGRALNRRVELIRTDR